MFRFRRSLVFLFFLIVCSTISAELQLQPQSIPPPNKDDQFGKDAWRVFRMASEFVDGCETMTKLGPSVSVFGSVRLSPDNPYYKMTVEVAQELAQRGFAIATGGGLGVMEAANRGARMQNRSSCGLGIDVPNCPNEFVDSRFSVQFRYFFIRKVMLFRYAQGLVFMPGGFGTMDELFEALTLIQTKKIRPLPIFLMGTAYWGGLIEWIKKTVLANGCISESDLALFVITDDPKVVADTIERRFQKENPTDNF